MPWLSRLDEQAPQPPYPNHPHRRAVTTIQKR